MDTLLRDARSATIGSTRVTAVRAHNTRSAQHPGDELCDAPAMHDDDPEGRPEAEPQAPRPSETLKGYRAAGWAAFGLALLCAMGIDRQLTPPRDPDWVTGALNFFALLAAQGVTSAAGVLFGLLEYTRPSHERDGWTGVVLWANVALAFGVSALLILSRP